MLSVKFALYFTNPSLKTDCPTEKHLNTTTKQDGEHYKREQRDEEHYYEYYSYERNELP